MAVSRIKIYFQKTNSQGRIKDFWGPGANLDCVAPDIWKLAYESCAGSTILVSRMLSVWALLNCRRLNLLIFTLRIYLCLMVSNCSDERTFPRLKLIKNELRSTMAQKRMNVLSLMSIESDILRKIDFTCVVEDFALRKSCKINVWKLLCIFNC